MNLAVSRTESFGEDVNASSPTPSISSVQLQRSNHKDFHRDMESQLLIPRDGEDSPDQIKEDPSAECLAPKWLRECDKKASGYVHRLEFGHLDWLFIPGAMLFGDKGMFLTLLLTLSIVSWRGVCFLAVCSLITVSLILVLKNFFHRERPNLDAIGQKKFLVRERVKSYSFPSGDSAQAGVFAMGMYLLTKCKFWGLGSIILAVWGRVYFGCHYFSDCACGAGVGMLVPWILCKVLNLYVFSFNAISTPN